MNTEIKDLYQDVILDHNKNPRNFREIEHADHKAEGYNPLCGDHLHIYMNLTGEVIDDVSFKGEGCAISKASASIMTTVLKGKTKEEAQMLFEQFMDLVTRDQAEEVDLQPYGKLAVFSGVREFPTRIKCATLAWHSSMEAIQEAQ